MTDSDKAASEAEGFKSIERSFADLKKAYEDKGVVTHRITTKDEAPAETPKVSNGDGGAV